MTNAIVIDGSQGEGGGQILRSSLALALVTGQSVQIEGIRAGRDKPGLMRQHLTAVRAAVEIGQASIDGDQIGSQSIRFEPRAIKSGDYKFSVGTAGSATLVLQTVLPALMIADGPSELTLEGGTHNPWSPPFDFLEHVYFPLLRKLGVNVATGLEHYGFYPAGGGRFSVEIQPTQELKGLQLEQRGEIVLRSATALVSNLSRRIAQREIDAVAEKLNWAPNCFHVQEVSNSTGPGNIVMIELHSENVREVFTGFGQPGVKAERVANDAAKQVRDYLAAEVPVGPYLADQLLLPLGIAAWKDGQSSSFRTLPLTRHSTTHINILKELLGIPISVEKEENSCTVLIGSN